MGDAEEDLPFEVGIMKIGLPILDRNLQELIKEIQTNARIMCQESRGTSTQEIACIVNREIQKLEIGSQEEMRQSIDHLADTLEEKVSVQPNNQHVIDKIKQMKNERNLAHQYEILAQIILLIRNVNVVPVNPVIEKIDTLERKIDNIIFYVEPGVREDLILLLGP